jgi:hypothetical protein
LIVCQFQTFACLTDDLTVALQAANFGYRQWTSKARSLAKRWACGNSRNSNMGKTAARLLYRGYFDLPVQVVLSGLQQTLLDRNHYRLRAVIGVQLTEDVFQVHLHRVLRNNQKVSDLFVSLSL